MSRSMRGSRAMGDASAERGTSAPGTANRLPPPSGPASTGKPGYGRQKELDNVRVAARILSGERGDPHNDNKILVEGGGSFVIPARDQQVPVDQAMRASSS